MRDESRDVRRGAARWLALLLMATCVVGHAGAEKGGMTKPRSARKIFDLTPPHPGEVLANPAKGSGSPPKLKEFAPSAAMHLSQEVAGVSTSDASGSGPQPGSANAGPRTPAAGPVVRPSDLQLQLTDEITRLGIDGFLSRPPQAASPQEQRYWETIRREVATSLATWQTLYVPSSASKSAGPQAPPAPPSSSPAQASGPKP